MYWIFISEDFFVTKPDPRFFQAVLEGIGLQDKSQALIIGDSITSDMLGGLQAGIDTCWYNPERKERNKAVPVTYEIHALTQLKEILAEEKAEL